MGGKANRTYLAFIEETAFGVPPGTLALEKLNFTGETLNYEIASKVPDTIRDDRMVSDIVLTSAGNSGGHKFELQFGFAGPNDELLLGALWAEEWLGVDGANTTLDLEGATLTLATKVLDCTGVTGNKGTMLAGHSFRLSGSASNNDGIYTVAAVTDAVNGIYVLVQAPTANETLPAGALAWGQSASNGVFRHTYAMEEGHADIDEYFFFTGQTIDEFSLNIEAEEIVTGDLTFVGQTVATGQVANGASYGDASTNPFMSASFNVESVYLDGAPISSCSLKKLEIKINNNVEGKTSVGYFGFCDTNEGEFECGGAIELYFNSMDNFDKFRTNTAFSLLLILADSLGNYYVLNLPRNKYSSDAIDATGKNTDVMDDAEYMALADPTTDAMIIVTRIPTGV